MSGHRRIRRGKKSKRRGVTGRRWKRNDSQPLVHGDVDPTGLLTIINPDLGTKNGHRYASARCGCGCNAVVEARIDNFRAGKASCPTRRKAQKRQYMIRQEHINKVKLFDAMLSNTSTGLTAAAIDAGVEYAQRLTTDTTLQVDVKATFKPDLAARDLKRAAQVIQKYGKEKEPVKASINNVPSMPKPAASVSTPEEIQDFANTRLISQEDFQNLLKNGQWTTAGRAAFVAGQPPPPPTEPDLTPVVPYLDVNYGYVTFGRVPRDMRAIDGKPIRDLLVNAGIIDAKLLLTEKGKAWFTRCEHKLSQAIKDGRM